MADKQPIEEKSIATNGVPIVTPWTEAQEQLASASKYWLATINADAHPHVMPLFGVWFDGSLYFTSSDKALKAKNLAQNPHCVITVSVEHLDLIIEGDALKITDEAHMQQIAALYASKYDWHITPHNGAYDADYGAPSAGPPPYELYQIHITKGFGFHTAEPYGATRWRFE
jgi:hypothetical protein